MLAKQKGGRDTLSHPFRHLENVLATPHVGYATEDPLPNVLWRCRGEHFRSAWLNMDDIRRAKELAPTGIHYVDVGTSGGVWGLERGYCMMVGGENSVVPHLDPIFAMLAPGIRDIPRTAGREQVIGTSEQGYLHCGPNGAGHFVKMVHNGIEYGP